MKSSTHIWTGFAFVQYDSPISATNAIAAENGSFLAGQRILVKAAEMKSQKRTQAAEIQNQQSEMQNLEPMNKSEYLKCEVKSWMAKVVF